jgi:glycosyltransferase involved in cell wall biosynthesis
MLNIHTKVGDVDILNVIIPTRNSEDVLETCLKSLSLQTMPVKVIIVDAMSTDKTREIAARYGCTILDEPKSSGMGSKRAVACNYGLKFVDSELTAFLDSDTEIPSTWADDMEEAFSDLGQFDGQQVAGITSGCTPDISSDLSTAINSIMKLSSNHAQGYKDYVKVNSLPGYNCVYQTRILKAKGGFNEELGGCEDWELNYRIRQSGYALVGIPHSPVIHHERKTIQGFKKQMKGYGWSWGRMLTVKHYFLPSRALPSLIILLSLPFSLLPFFLGTGSLLGCIAFFSFCWIFVALTIKKDYPNKYYTMFRIALILGVYFGIGYIKALFNQKA